MLKITIKSTEVNTKSGNAQRTGKAYSIREQEGWIQLNGETRRINVSLQKDVDPWPVGVYEVTDESYYVDNFGALALGRLKLKSAAASPVGVRASA